MDFIEKARRLRQMILEQAANLSDDDAIEVPFAYPKWRVGVEYFWVQPDSTNPYMIGDKVRHNGKIWVSIVDYNVWEPGVYGWEESSE